MVPRGEFPPNSRISGFFASTKLTIFLCLILAVLSVVGSIVYRGSTAFEEGPGFSVFSSPFFLLPSALLLINILFCVSKRVARGKVRGKVFLITAHISMVFAISGLMIDGRYGEIYTGYFSLKRPSDAVFNWRENTDWQLPFKMEVSEYTIYHYPLMLKVGVKQNSTDEEIGQFIVNEGESLAISGTGLVLENLDFDLERKELLFEGRYKGEVLGNYRADVNGSVPMGDGYVIAPVAYRELGVKNMVARLNIIDKENKYEYVVSPNHPAVYEDLNISLVESRMDEYQNLYVGFQITRTPGEWVFWIGTIGFLGFVLVHLLVRGEQGKRPFPDSEYTNGKFEGENSKLHSP